VLHEVETTAKGEWIVSVYTFTLHSIPIYRIPELWILATNQSKIVLRFKLSDMPRVNYIPFPKLINYQLFFHHGKKRTAANLAKLVATLLRCYVKWITKFRRKANCTDLTSSKIAQSVYRRATGWTAGVPFLAQAIDFSLLHAVQKGCEAHPASYPVGTWGCSQGENRLVCEGDQSRPSSAEVKNGGTTHPCPIRLYDVVLN
jgi:hypothetical protein